MRTPLSKVVELSGYTVLSVLLLAVGFYHGFQMEIVTIELLFVTVYVAFVEAIPSAIVFTSFVLITGALLLKEVYRDRDPDEAIRDGPAITAIVPVYRDHAVLENSVTSLHESAYENLRVLIVCEEDDEPTVAEAQRLAGLDDVEYAINRRPGSKAGAINYAVEIDDADYFAVFDADEVIDPEFVPSAMYFLCEDDRDVFQGRRVPKPTGLVESLAYAERVIFHSSYKIVELLGFSNCRSSSTAFTREAFEAVGGYDDLLTEDLAFAHACYRQGLDVKQARNYTNQMEAAHTLVDLWGQRKRWRTGQIEVLHETIRTLPRAEHPIRALISLGRIASSLLASVFMLMLAAKFIVLLLLGFELVFLVPLVSTVVLVGAVAYRDASDGKAPGIGAGVLLTPFIYPVFGLMTVKCLFEYVLSWDGEWYRVEKTGT